MTNEATSGGQPSHGQTRIEIYTDGSAIGNPGPGGYGGVLLRLDADGMILKTREFSEPSNKVTTNIRMEMTAALVALQRLGRKTTEPITIYCDCNLIPNAMNQWLAGWRAKGWTRGKGKPVENRDLWQKLGAEAEGRDVTFLWVRGHNGTVWNERADALAHEGARLAEKRGIRPAVRRAA